MPGTDHPARIRCNANADWHSEEQTPAEILYSLHDSHIGNCESGRPRVICGSLLSLVIAGKMGWETDQLRRGLRDRKSLMSEKKHPNDTFLSNFC